MKKLYNTQILLLTAVLTLWFSLGAIAQNINIKGELTSKAPAKIIPAQVDDIEAILYDQTASVGADGLSSQDFDTANDAYDSFCADDFTISSGTWRIYQVIIAGFYYNGFGPAQSFHVYFYNNNAGVPGTIAVSRTAQPYTTAGGLFIISLTTPVDLNAGTYWVSVQARMDFGTGGQFAWLTSGGAYGNIAQWQNPNGGFGGCTTWGPITTCNGVPETDMYFAISGTAGTSGPGAATNPTPADGATEVSVTGSSLHWTNPGTATSIQVFMGTSIGGLTSVYSGTPITSYSLGTLEYNTQYFWQIYESNISGTVQGYIWTFSTESAFTDNFDSYTAGTQLCTQTTLWQTWHNTPGSAEDPFVSTTHSNSTPNSVKIIQNNDLVRVNGSKTSGKWYMSFLFYIPTGKTGYFNTLAVFNGNNSDWGMEVYFNAGGAGQITAIPTPTNFTWQENVWNQVMVVVDLDVGTAEFWIGSGFLTQITTWDWTQGGTITPQLDANDFFGAAATNEMYLDDYYFSNEMPVIVQAANDVGTLSIDMATQVAPGTIAPLATVKNYGTATNSFNVQMTINPGGYSSTKSVSSLAAGATQQVTFDNWNASTVGAYTVNVCTQLGTDVNATNDCKDQPVYVWDNTGSWTSGSAYPTTTYLGGGVAVAGNIYSIAGNTTSGLGTECYKYNVATDTWSPIASLPGGRRVLAVAAAGNFVYAIGGSDMSSVYQSTVYKYDIAGNSWSTVASLPMAIGWGKAVGYNDQYIYFAGGVDASSNLLSSVYVYTVATNTWTTATSMPGNKFGGAFSATGNKLVYAGGADDAGISNTVYVGTITSPTAISWTTMDNPFPGNHKLINSPYDANLAALQVGIVKKGDHSPDAVAYPPGSMYRFDGAPWGTDGIIVAGGSPTSVFVPSDPNPCYVYKPSTDTWIAQANVPTPVLGSSIGTVNTGSTWKLVVASGLTTGSATTSVTQIYTQTLSPNTFPLSVAVSNGWNMTSVPGTNPAGMGVTNWWAHLTGAVYKFVPGSGYVAVTTTTPKEGYWMKNTLTETYSYPSIQIVTHNPISASSGWNMIGGYEDAVDVTTLTTTPSGQIVYPIYKYVPGTGYQTATTLTPGYGYWVKVSSNCQINIPDLPVDGLQKMEEYFKDDWGKITLTDATGSSYTLYAVKGKVDLDKYELPPLPPAGLFDVRFSSGRIAEDINSDFQTIAMNSVVYPVKVRVENMDIRIQDLTGKEINVNIKAGEEITINNANINKIMVSANIVPDKYALEQNYPNPFNPSTTINFSLPEATNVTLIVYNALGQKVAELVNQKMEAGKYTYQWNAKNVATGMYIYEMRTEKFVSIKKMLLLK